MDIFKKNMIDLFKDIQYKATQIKEEVKKEREAEAAQSKAKTKSK